MWYRTYKLSYLSAFVVLCLLSLSFSSEKYSGNALAGFEKALCVWNLKNRWVGENYFIVSEGEDSHKSGFKEINGYFLPLKRFTLFAVFSLGPLIGSLNQEAFLLPALLFSFIPLLRSPPFP
ncbi:MAG: hypothetical protein KatS3mg078_2004 [Deltaproteobacteria bacterium]|jgi:hypothetical protein|nr:MAG: hypothetical protein KatS3mg078_2004 [Deltaproteobacteria bacterium]